MNSSHEFEPPLDLLPVSDVQDESHSDVVQIKGRSRQYEPGCDTGIVREIRQPTNTNQTNQQLSFNTVFTGQCLQPLSGVFNP